MTDDPSAARERSTPRRAGPAAAVAAAVHLAVAAAYALSGRIDVRADAARADWDWYWQTLRAADLRARPFESLWHLHSQPPGFNALGAILLRVAPEGRLPETLHAIHIGLGAAICAMAAFLVSRWTASIRLAAVTGLVLALNPALLLYEAYPLYEMETAFLVVLTVWALQRGIDRGRDGPLYGCVAAACALLLTRSSFHLVLLPVVVLLAWFASADRRRFLAVAAAISLSVVGWYAKNEVQHGFFGASSWGGQSLFRIASARYSAAELRELASLGVIDPMTAEIEPFSPPSAYAGRGFDVASDVPSLSRDDLHAESIVGISRRYGESARALIAHDPAHYAANVAAAYRMFCSPTVNYKHLHANRERIAPHANVYVDVLTLGGFVGAGESSVLLVLVPAVPLLVALLAMRDCGRSRAAWSEWLRRNSAVALACALVLYGAAAGSLLEYGENERYEFEVETLLAVLFVTVVVATWRARAGRRIA